MIATDLILKKRNGDILTDSEIEFIVSGYTNKEIPDYQMAAFCMAVYFQGMSSAETTALTLAMSNSGMRYNLEAIDGIPIDKHSTGGVGDTTTLIVAPLVASCGVPIAKMSGRGLGHTGGTIDKLESIPNFNLQMSQAEFIKQVNEINLAIISQSNTIAPADQSLYALRDVTATVDSIPLIASSIMSKKIASGASGFVLDVKAGIGAFMNTVEDATELATTMVDIGELVKRPTVALITNMDQPLGNAIGNALEVQEAIEILSGSGSDDLQELSLRLGAEMLVLAGHSSNIETAYNMLVKQLKSGAGLQKFGEMIKYQSGDIRVIENPDLLAQAKYKTEVKSNSDGYIESVNPLELGRFSMALGAGRATKESKIDLSVGIKLKKKRGSYVKNGDTLAIIHSNEPLNDHQLQQVRDCYKFSQDSPKPHELIHKRIVSNIMI